MLSRIKNKKSFKEDNLKSWQENTDFWLRHPIVDVKVQSFISQTMYSLCSQKQKTIIDLGCGNGWLLQSLKKRNITFSKYLGIDFNHRFIEFLNKKYITNNANFKCLDFEKEFPEDMTNTADIVVNCLNLIETPNLGKVFHNIAKITKTGGTIIIVSLNPFIEIIRDSKDLEDQNKNLAIYEFAKENTIIFKKIRDKSEVSQSNYYRILYSSSDYINMARKYNLTIANSETFYGNNNVARNPLFEFYQFIK